MHPLNREHQAETYQKLVESKRKYIITEAPTGSGKSAYAAQAGNDSYRTMALVRTKSLQEQYSRSYDFKVVKGKGSYACLHNFVPTCDMCQLDDKEAKNECLLTCPYPDAVHSMLRSNLASLNYSKYLTEIRPKGLVEQYDTNLLFLDEAHQLSDIVIDWSGCTIPWNDYLKGFIEPDEIVPELPQAIGVGMAVDWLGSLAVSLENNEPYRPRKNPTQEQVKAWRRWDSLKRKVDNTLELVDQGTDLWYAQSDENVGFKLKPLTARFHFKDLFSAPKVVMMSATIGNHSAFLAELGIREDYESIIVPNVWPGPMRPILDLDVPPITAKSSEADLQEHARVIGQTINDCPGDWNGLVHVPSKKMAWDLGNRLKRLTKRPVWIPQGEMGTEQAISQWLEFEQRRKGAVACTWQFMEGVDLPNLNINITARVPYPDFGDRFERLRFDFDPRAAQVRVANTLQQQQGRNRRGHEAHYGGDSLKLNAIADAKWRKIKWAFSEAFLEAIQ